MKYLSLLSLLSFTASAMDCAPFAVDVTQERALSFAEKQQAILPLFQQRCKDRAALEKMRDQFDVSLTEKTPFFAALEFSHHMRHFINAIFIQELSKLGECPSPLAVVLFGSLSRLEASPYTDLEYGFVVAKDSEKMRKFCFKLAQRVADRIYALGESDDMGCKGLHIDDGNMAPLHFNWSYRYANVEDYVDHIEDAQSPNSWVYQLNNPDQQTSTPVFCGSRQLVADCPKFASFLKTFQESPAMDSDPEETFFAKLMNNPLEPLEKRFIGATIRPNLRNHSILFVMGDPNLMAQIHFCQEMVANAIDENDQLRLLPTIRTNLEMMRKNIEILRAKSFNDTEGGPACISFKKDIYRFAEQMLTGMAGICGLPQQNSWDILMALGRGKITSKGKLIFHDGVVPSDIAYMFYEVLSFSMKMNFEQQLLAHEQVPTFYTQPMLLKNKIEFEKNYLNFVRQEINILRSERAEIEIPATMDEEESASKMWDVINSKLNNCFQKELNSIQNLRRLKQFRPDTMMTPEGLQYLQSRIIPKLDEIANYFDRFITGYLGSLGNPTPKKY